MMWNTEPIIKSAIQAFILVAVWYLCDTYFWPNVWKDYNPANFYYQNIAVASFVCYWGGWNAGKKK